MHYNQEVNYGSDSTNQEKIVSHRTKGPVKWRILISLGLSRPIRSLNRFEAALWTREQQRLLRQVPGS